MHQSCNIGGRWLAAFLLLAGGSLLHAGNNNNVNGFRSNSVGGVSINAEGVVGQAAETDRRNWLKYLRQQMQQVRPELRQASNLRMISLRQLDEAIRKAQAAGQELSDEMRYLAGLQRIQYVFVYPEKNDVVIAGPGEGWIVNQGGTVVGETTHRPVLLLDDLLVALRSVDAARTEGITCSIDPTPEGRQAFDNVIRRQRTFSPRVTQALSHAMGHQEVTITGVPADSHFARVLVAADYHMKRLAMHLDPTPLPQTPSFLTLLQKRGQLPGTATPRWWLACNYEPLACSEDRLSWELRGPGVKAMTENEIVQQDGQIQGTGRQDPIAQIWSENMTKNYHELAKHQPVFQELRNAMDMCVVAALISKNRLLEKAGCQLPALAGKNSNLEIESWHTPKKIATQCSFIKVRRNYVITASGGVEVESWDVAANTQVVPAVGQVRAKAAQSAATWWWN